MASEQEENANMALRPHSIINVEDPSHPMARVTEQNWVSSPLWSKIPIEIRLKIYGFAVCVDTSVRPKQIGFRSNKFVWGKSESVKSDNRAMLRNRDQPLTISNLARVCRAIYYELDAHPVFYQVNIFVFADLEDLYHFLVALTPRRLSMIRYISISISANFLYEDGVQQSNWKGHQESRCLELLSQCHNIKELTLEVHISPGPFTEYWARNRLAMIQKYLDISYTDLGVPSLVNLPFFRILVPFDHLGYGPILGRLHHTPGNYWHVAFRREPGWMTIKLVESANLAMRRRDAFNIHHGYVDTMRRMKKRPQWLIDLANNKDALDQARADARIDFPGHNRVAQDFRLYDRDVVSSNTRKEFRFVNQELAIVERLRAKYGADGELNWGYELHDVRWTDEEKIECQVSFRYPPGVPDGLFWEPIERVATGNGLVWFYETSPFKNIEDDKERVRLIRALPSPNDVIRYLDGMEMLINHTRTKKQTTLRLARWKKITKDWDKRITSLQYLIDKRDEKQAAREAKAAQRLAAREEKKKNKGKKGRGKRKANEDDDEEDEEDAGPIAKRLRSSRKSTE